MGITADIFAARRQNLSPALLSSGPQPPLASLSSKGVDTIKMATLATIFQNEDLKNVKAVVARQPPVALEAGDDGPWIFAIPDQVTQRLAALDDAARAEIAEKWASTDEWRLSRWPRPEYDRWFNELCDLARAATRVQLSLWLWMCL
jgi:hypothetical protein